MIKDKYQALKVLKDIVSDFEICIKEINERGVPIYHLVTENDIELDEDDIVINFK